MAAVFLYCQCCIQPRLICRGGKRLRQRQAVFIVSAAEDPKRDVLLPKRCKIASLCSCKTGIHGLCRIRRSQRAGVNAIARSSISHPAEKPPHAILS